MKADLHMHTTISDGSDTIFEIVNKCAKSGLTHIAITNHDDMDGYEEISRVCRKLNIKTVKSIEMTTFDRETELKAHILGYDIKAEEPIRKLSDRMLKSRNENSLKQIELLKADGYDIDIEDLYKKVYKIIYKQNIMRYLVDKGVTDRIYGEFYEKYFGKNGKINFRGEDTDTEDAIKAIVQSGGKAVLAHPGQQQNFILIDKFVSVGLKGVEYNHHSNSPEDKKIIAERAKKYGLFLTGGSDYHGTNSRGNIYLAMDLCPPDGVNAIFG